MRFQCFSVLAVEKRYIYSTELKMGYTTLHKDGKKEYFRAILQGLPMNSHF